MRVFELPHRAALLRAVTKGIGLAIAAYWLPAFFKLFGAFAVLAFVSRADALEAIGPGFDTRMFIDALIQLLVALFGVVLVVRGEWATRLLARSLGTPGAGRGATG